MQSIPETLVIPETLALLRQRRLSASALVERALMAAEGKSSLNAFIAIDAEAAMAQAHQVDALYDEGEDPGPLAGLPFVVKDNINLQGWRTTAGTPAIHFIAESSAPVAARMTEAGAVVIGKTNMHELAFGVTSNNGAYGAVRHAQDPSRFAGGSSGGTATAIAAGIVSAGLGTDTAGSVRLPAGLSGVVGFRPTTWLIEQEGVVPSVPSFDVVGPMASSVADAAFLFSLMTGKPAPRSETRLGKSAPGPSAALLREPVA